MQLPAKVASTARTRPHLPSASLNRNAHGVILNGKTSNVGIVGIDARWAEYGEYLHDFIEVIQAQWYRIIEGSHVTPPHGSHVVVTFRLSSKGEATIVKVEDADAGKQGVIYCENAITDPQPYRKWTDKMISTLGDSQELNFAFYYQ